jgi:methionyl-tRNA synthetase
MSKPWEKILSFGPGEPGEDVDKIIFEAAEALRMIGILLQPYMPNKANMLLDQLGVHRDRRTFKWCKPGVDLEYGEPIIELGSGHKGVLFPPLTSEE